MVRLMVKNSLDFWVLVDHNNHCQQVQFQPVESIYTDYFNTTKKVEDDSEEIWPILVGFWSTGELVWRRKSLSVFSLLSSSDNCTEIN